jgi:hypothetical protein
VDAAVLVLMLGEVSSPEFLEVLFERTSDVVIERLHDGLGLLALNSECSLDGRQDRLPRDRREKVVEKLGLLLFDHRKIVGNLPDVRKSRGFLVCRAGRLL